MVSEDLLKSFNISTVARGTVSETCGFVEPNDKRYKLPKSKGIFRCSLIIMYSTCSVINVA